MMELPNYHWPDPRSIVIGLWQRVVIFMRRVGGVILTMTILLWFLASFPGAPRRHGARHRVQLCPAASGPCWRMCLPAGLQLADQHRPGARHGGTRGDGQLAGHCLCALRHRRRSRQALMPVLAQAWSLPTALALLAWFVFAPQCLSTLATVKRETGGWKMPALMAGYLFALAYLAAFITYRVASALL